MPPAEWLGLSQQLFLALRFTPLIGRLEGWQTRPCRGCLDPLSRISGHGRISNIEAGFGGSRSEADRMTSAGKKRENYGDCAHMG